MFHLKMQLKCIYFASVVNSIYAGSVLKRSNISALFQFFVKNEQNAVFLSLCYSADWNVCFSESNWGEEGRQLYQGMGSATQNRLQFSEEKHDDNLRPFT